MPVRYEANYLGVFSGKNSTVVIRNLRDQSLVEMAYALQLSGHEPHVAP